MKEFKVVRNYAYILGDDFFIPMKSQNWGCYCQKGYIGYLPYMHNKSCVFSIFFKDCMGIKKRDRDVNKDTYRDWRVEEET